LAASDDQAALRRLLATLPRGGERDAARERLVQLQLHQLHQIAALPDALARFAALTGVESDGLQPEPARIAAAQRVALQTELAQAELALAGADLLAPAAVDGIPGPATVQALRALQRRLGLPESGALDARTSAALAALLDAGGTLPAPAAALDNNLPAGPSIPRPGERFRDCAECPVLVVLPQGSAPIGDVQGTGDPDERPVRELSLTYALAVGLTEVTALEWEACVRGGGCAALPLPGQSAQPGRPAAGISLSQARAYVSWLRSRTGLPYRLLSEAEWEFAARGGQTSAFGPAAGPEELCRFANGADAASPYPWRNPACADAYPDRPAPVGHLAPNGFGLHDTLGNLWEWVEDCWHPSYVGAPADMGAWKSGCTGTFGVLRGGAYSVDPQKVRVSYRFPHTDAPLPFFGLRVARSL
jgi:formylglycine-generating enzyme required for sulfatase activity